MKKKSLPSQEYLLDFFDINHDGDLVWKERPSEHFLSIKSKSIYESKTMGRLAGTRKPSGYIDVIINRITYKAHRIIYKIHYGIEPEVIDHIDGNQRNNSISNLRSVSTLDNNKNAKKRRDNNSGIMGVCKKKERTSWEAYINNNGKNVYLGSYYSFFEACCARKSAEINYGYHKNHGRNYLV